MALDGCSQTSSKCAPSPAFPRCPAHISSAPPRALRCSSSQTRSLGHPSSSLAVHGAPKRTNKKKQKRHSLGLTFAGRLQRRGGGVGRSARAPAAPQCTFPPVPSPNRIRPTPSGTKTSDSSATDRHFHTPDAGFGLLQHVQCFLREPSLPVHPECQPASAAVRARTQDHGPHHRQRNAWSASRTAPAHRAPSAAVTPASNIEMLSLLWQRTASAQARAPGPGH